MVLGGGGVVGEKNICRDGGLGLLEGRILT